MYCTTFVDFFCWWLYFGKDSSSESYYVFTDVAISETYEFSLLFKHKQWHDKAFHIPNA